LNRVRHVDRGYPDGVVFDAPMLGQLQFGGHPMALGFTRDAGDHDAAF